MNFDISIPDEFLTLGNWGGACVLAGHWEALRLLDDPECTDATSYSDDRPVLPREIGEFRGMRVLVGYGVFDSPLIVHLKHSSLAVDRLRFATGQAMAEAIDKAILGEDYCPKRGQKLAG